MRLNKELNTFEAVYLKDILVYNFFKMKTKFISYN